MSLNHEHNKNGTATCGSCNTKKAGWGYIFSALGPGLILAATSIGPGSIVNGSVAGSSYGYSLFWWFVIVLLFRGIYQYAMNLYSVVNGMSVVDGIRTTYGKTWAILVGVCAFAGQLVYGIGNFMGTGMGLNIIFPNIPIKTAGVIMTIVCIIVLLTKDLYQKMESLMKILVALMIAVFLVALIMAGGPSFSGIAAGVVPSIPEGSLVLMFSLLGTTASLATTAWGSALTKEKKWTTDDINNGGMGWDTIIGVGSIGLIAFLVWFTSAEILPNQPVGSGLELANSLVPVIGAVARPIIGIGFLAAAISSLMMAPKIGVSLLMDALGKTSGMENRTENIISICMLIFAGIIGLSVGRPPVQMLMLAQTGAIINTPILGVMTILLINRPEMGEYKASKRTTATLSIAYIFILIMVINNLINLIK